MQGRVLSQPGLQGFQLLCQAGKMLPEADRHARGCCDDGAEMAQEAGLRRQGARLVHTHRVNRHRHRHRSDRSGPQPCPLSSPPPLLGYMIHTTNAPQAAAAATILEACAEACRATELCQAFDFSSARGECEFMCVPARASTVTTQETWHKLLNAHFKLRDSERAGARS